MMGISARILRAGMKVRPFSSAATSPAFKVQDNKDFIERVKNSKVPVIIDFFAT